MQVFRRLLIVLGLVLLGAGRPALGQAAGQAQDPGLAVITSPLEGAVLGGAVPILGSATHPQFVRYDLAFAYSPNPTDTWFAIPAVGTTPVVNEALGQWDTLGITDGLYTVRLRVFYADGAFLEAYVPNVRVQNAPPTPALSASPVVATDPGQPAVTPTPAATATPVIILPATLTPRPTPGPAAGGAGPASPDSGPQGLNASQVGAAFLEGVRLTGLTFLIMGAYVSLRALLRMRPRR